MSVLVLALTLKQLCCRSHIESRKKELFITLEDFNEISHVTNDTPFAMHYPISLSQFTT